MEDAVYKTLEFAMGVSYDIILFKSPHFVLKYEPENQWIYADWIGKQTLETVIYNCRMMVKGVEKYSCNKVLNDNTHLSGTWEHSVEWLEKEWIPALYAAGCEYFAWIHSPCTHSQASIQKTVMLNFRNIEVLIFDDIETAKAWLKQT